MKSIARFLFAIVVFSHFSFAQNTPPSPPTDLDEWVARAMKEFSTPGAAVAIVKDGKVVAMKGYGLRTLGTKDRVDENTLFAIASNTKAFTATALAILVDEGKITWDDKVIDHMPAFRMSDPYVTREITIRDLLTHRSGMGLGAGDLMFFPPSNFTREQIIHSQRNIPLTTSFRSRFAYDNVLYIVAGQIIRAVTNKSWEDFIRERIFKQLGMTNSLPSAASLKPSMNFASPHPTVEGKVAPINLDQTDNHAAAGGINSSVSDLTKWIIARLDEGKMRGGKSLYSKAQATEMWSGQTILPIGEPPPELAHMKAHFSEYGLGVFLRDYRGRKLVSHTGGLIGYVSKIVMVPEEKLGIIILTNGESGETFDSIAWHVVDHYLGAPSKDYISLFAKAREKEQKESEEAIRKASSVRNRDSKPSLPLEKYAGKYHDAWYGDATISVESGKLRMKFSHSPGLNGELEHFQYDTFIAKWIEATVPAAYVTFALQADGSIRDIRMKAVSPLADFSYDFQDLLFLPSR